MFSTFKDKETANKTRKSVLSQNVAIEDKKAYSDTHALVLVLLLTVQQRSCCPLIMVTQCTCFDDWHVIRICAIRKQYITEYIV